MKSVRCHSIEVFSDTFFLSRFLFQNTCIKLEIFVNAIFSIKLLDLSFLDHVYLWNAVCEAW